MASTSFTLAALATSAVPGLKVTGARPHSSGSGGSFESAVLETDSGDVIVRIPVESGAEVRQSAEMLALAALVDGARSRLPFALPTTLGMTRAGDSRAVVSSFISGTPASAEVIDSQSALLQHIVEGIAAIHELPSGLVRDGGLPARSTEEVRLIASRLIQRAVETGMLPATVRQRWFEVLDADAVWSFEPAVVHGSLAPEQFLADGDEVIGVLGWGTLALGDPAADLGWLLAVGPEVFSSALARYAALRGVSGVQELTARARFYHELEIAKWLLHGFEAHDQQIVDDAVNMLDRLVDRLGLLGEALPRRRVLTEHEVAQLLEETPEVEYDARSETAEFDSLDEDRVFASDDDFTEEQPENSNQVAPEKSDREEDDTQGEDLGPGAVS